LQHCCESLKPSILPHLRDRQFLQHWNFCKTGIFCNTAVTTSNLPFFPIFETDNFCNTGISARLESSATLLWQPQTFPSTPSSKPRICIYHKDEGKSFLRNIGTHLLTYIASQSARPQYWFYGAVKWSSYITRLSRSDSSENMGSRCNVCHPYAGDFTSKFAWATADIFIFLQSSSLHTCIVRGDKQRTSSCPCRSLYPQTQH
jgi:hypothetical protein